MAKVYTRQEVQQRRMNYRVFAGLYDFLAVLAGIAVIALSIFIIATLIGWVKREGNISFASLWNIFQSAIIIPS